MNHGTRPAPWLLTSIIPKTWVGLGLGGIDRLEAMLLSNGFKRLSCHRGFSGLAGAENGDEPLRGFRQTGDKRPNMRTPKLGHIRSIPV